MISIIISAIAIFIAIGIIGLLLEYITKIIKLALLVAVMTIIGPPIIIGYILEVICDALSMKKLASVLLAIVAWVAFIACGFLDIHPSIYAFTFDSLKFALQAVLFFIMLYCHRAQLAIEQISEQSEFLQKKEIEFYICFFSSFVMLFASMRFIYSMRWIGH